MFITAPRNIIPDLIGNPLLFHPAAKIDLESSYEKCYIKFPSIPDSKVREKL